MALHLRPKRLCSLANAQSTTKSKRLLSLFRARGVPESRRLPGRKGGPAQDRSAGREDARPGTALVAEPPVPMTIRVTRFLRGRDHTFVKEPTYT